MSACSPQRFLANNRNLFRTAVLTPSSVLPVANQVKPLPTARSGTAQVSLNGTYTGSEQADFELEITDAIVEVPRVSTPVFNGAGSGTVSDITASGTAQDYTAECADAGTETTTASVQIEGATIKARTTGADGNSIRITVDQSTLVFTASDYSLLADLQAGQGGPSSPLIGQGFDFDTKALDGNGLIPADAHRIAFGNDRSAIYLAYREYINGEWAYHTVPALQRDVPKGTQIYFVTGGRTVSVTNVPAGLDVETYPDIVTAYDLLYALRTQSILLVVDGVVVNDRTPTGQAARELQLRTDAHAEVSYGSGSSYAKGLEDVTVDAAAGTQLITLTCYAVNSGDHPFARLGSTRWLAESSLLGVLGSVTEGVPFVFQGAAGGTIPVRLPIGMEFPKGRFSVDEIIYATATETPICPVSLTLGPDAVDQVIDLIYTARPSGDCNCTGMPAPNLKTACLGNPTEGGGLVAYQPDTIARLVDLRSWKVDLVIQWTAYGDPEALDPGYSARQADAISTPKDNIRLLGGLYNTPAYGAAVALATKSLNAIVNTFETVAAQIDPLTPGTASLREAGFAAWDVAVAALKADIDALGSPVPYQYNIPSERYDSALDLALTSAGIPVSGGVDADTIVSGDGCWRDYGGTAYWKVVGSLKGAYMPLFSNHPYYSARDSAEGGVFSTHEFALQLNIKCPEDLQIGDRVRLVISESSRGATYVQGDQIELPIVAAAPRYLTGGQTGNPVQDWNVSGSVDGPLATYAFNPDAPAPYVSADLSFLLNEGGIPFAKGDRFTWSIEGGHFRWRKNGGAWQDASPPAAIPLTSILIDEGLSAIFTGGASTSFVAGDLFRFRARQPWAVSNTQTPSSAVWKWSGSTATYDADLGSIQQLDLIAIQHNLPAGATISISSDTGVLLGEDGTPLLNEDGTELLTEGFAVSEDLTYRAGVIWQEIDKYARYVRLTITNAEGGSIQWPWIGIPLVTTLSAETQISRDYKINRPGGNLQGGRFVGKAVSGDVSWTESALKEADAEGLVAMLDHIKENNDEPIMFISQDTRVDDPVLVAYVQSDAIEFRDYKAYNQRQELERRVSARLPLEGVWQ